MGKLNSTVKCKQLLIKTLASFTCFLTELLRHRCWGIWYSEVRKHWWLLSGTFMA